MSSPNQHQEIHARLEAIQRQVSRMVACGIIASFFIFMAGYSAGKKYVIEEFHGALSSHSFADMVYSAFRSAQEAFTPYEERVFDISPNKEETRRSESGEMKGAYSGKLRPIEIARFGTNKEADILYTRLGEAGFETRVYTEVSETQGGSSYEWYRVCVHQDRPEADFMKAVEALRRRYRLNQMSITNTHEADDKVQKEREIV